MLRIAICDDDIHFLEQIHQLTQAELMQLDISLEAVIETFDDGIHLVEKIRKGSRYDIALLDWDMPILGGEEAGRALREIDKECLIIFITAYKDFALRAYHLTTFRYILKENMENELPEALCAALERQHSTEEFLLVKTDQNTLIQIRLCDLYCAEYLNRQIVFSTKHGVYHSVQRAQLKDLEEQLLVQGFVKPYKGVLVNVAEIREKHQHNLLISNGRSFPVSRSYQNHVMMAMSKHMEGRI
jgi:DNA-binding LytR/AlgR family response regulator